MKNKITKLYLDFKNSLPDSCFLCTLVGSMLLGGIPALGFVVLAISGNSTQGIPPAILASAIAGAAGGMAVYFTRNMRKKNFWGLYLGYIIVAEAYITTATLCIFLLVFLYPSLKDQDFNDTFQNPYFHLALHIYALFLVTISLGITSIQKKFKKS